MPLAWRRLCGCSPRVYPFSHSAPFPLGVAIKTIVIAGDASFRIPLRFRAIKPGTGKFMLLQETIGKRPQRCVTKFRHKLFSGAFYDNGNEWLIDNVDDWSVCNFPYLSSKIFSAAPSGCCASFHSVRSRCRSCPSWACHWGTRCKRWLVWAYPLCSVASHRAELECAFGDLRRLRWLTAFVVVHEDWLRDVAGLVEKRIWCDGTLVFVCKVRYLEISEISIINDTKQAVRGLSKISFKSFSNYSWKFFAWKKLENFFAKSCRKSELAALLLQYIDEDSSLLFVFPQS